jgi:hypothetical protein
LLAEESIRSSVVVLVHVAILVALVESSDAGEVEVDAKLYVR